MASWITRTSPKTVSLEGKTQNGEWKFVDCDWSEWTPQQRQGRWLRTTWDGVRQVLDWIPASYQESKP